MIRGHQTHTIWIAFLLHRISGVALALFIPVHFWVLSYALTAPKTLDGFLHWTELGIVKFAEFGLVFLLCICSAACVSWRSNSCLGPLARKPWQPAQLPSRRSWQASSF